MYLRHVCFKRDGDVHVFPSNTEWTLPIYLTSERSHTKRNTEYLFIHGNTFSCYTEGNRWHHWEIKATISTQLIKKVVVCTMYLRAEKKESKEKKKDSFVWQIVWLPNKLLGNFSTPICRMCTFMKTASEQGTMEGVWRQHRACRYTLDFSASGL